MQIYVLTLPLTPPEPLPNPFLTPIFTGLTCFFLTGLTTCYARYLQRASAEPVWAARRATAARDFVLHGHSWSHRVVEVLDFFHALKGRRGGVAAHPADAVFDGAVAAAGAEGGAQGGAQGGAGQAGSGACAAGPAGPTGNRSELRPSLADYHQRNPYPPAPPAHPSTPATPAVARAGDGHGHGHGHGHGDGSLARHRRVVADKRLLPSCRTGDLLCPI